MYCVFAVSASFPYFSPLFFDALVITSRSYSSCPLQFQSTWWSVLLLSARGANCVVSQDIPCTEKEQVDVVAEYAEQLRGGASVASSVAAVRAKALPLDEALKQSTTALFLHAVRGGCVVMGAADLKYE